MKNQLIIPASGTGLSSAWRPLWLAAALALPTLAGAQTFALTNLWRLATNVVSSSNNLVNGDNNRGMACLASSNLVFVSNKGNTTISAIDGTTGARVGFVNMTGVAGSGTWQINQLAVADDGILYGAGLTTALSAASGYKLYRWADWSQPPTLAFASTNSALTNYIAGKRVGDTIAITGAGSDTRILVQVENSTTPTGTNLLLSTTDGTNFTPTVLYSLLPTLSNGGAGPQFGYQFYTNNTFLFKPAGAALYLIQFPPNFASLASPVQAPVLLTNTVSGVLAGNSVLLAYHQTAGHLGVYGPMVNAAPATVPVNLYNILALSGLSASLAATNTSHTAANGNFAGAVALGGAGRTNVIYTLDCNSCLTASAILSVAPQPPLITTAPVGGTLYPPMTLSVGISPSSSKPLYYQWQASTNGTATATTFTNIPGALTNSYALGTSLTNYFRVVVTNSIGAVTSAPVLVTLLSAVTNPVVSQLWRVAAGQAGYAYLNPSDNNSRGIAYDTNSQRVVVASVSGGPGLYLLDGNTGTNLGTLNLTGALLTGFSGVALDQVGIADDGAVFAGNLASGGSAFNLTYWPAPTTNAAAYQAYSGDPGGTGSDRWGDSLAVRGAGSTTEILLGSRTGTNVALLTTGDGSNFVANLLAITNAPAGFAANGIAFGAGNTLWAKANLGNLWAVAYDPMTLSGGVVFDYAQPSQAPTYMVGVGLDPAHSILAGIVLSDTPHDLRLYQLTGTSDAPILFQQSFFAAANANGNANAAIAMKYPRVYGLDVNNGIVALTYGVPASSPPAIVTPPASRTVYTNDPAATLSVQVSGSLPLYYQWRFNATNIPGATAQSYTLTNPPLTAAGYYDVVVRNIAGTVTSTPPALLTVITPVVSPTVTRLWALPAGSRAYLDGFSYNTRGLACDTNTSTVLLADHNNIYVLDALTGAELFQLNTLGLPTAGYNGWVLDQIGVADDGVVYGANLTLDGSGFAITSWSAVSQSATLNSAWGGAGADPSGTGDRWGDTLTVRGAGANTQILLGSYNNTNVLLFTTTDGVNFTPTLITVTNAGVPLGFAGAGIAFGFGNTFWAKGGHNYNLRQVAFDLATNPGIGSVVQLYAAGTQVPNDLTGLGVDVPNNVLAGVCFNNTPGDLQLYLLSTNPPALFDQAFFASNNLNSQQNAVTTLRNGLAFGLNVNNGVVALGYQVPPSLPPVATTILSVKHQAASGLTLTWQSVPGRTYQVQSKTALTSGSWSNVGPVLGTLGPTTSYTDTTAVEAERFYRICVQ